MVCAVENDVILRDNLLGVLGGEVSEVGTICWVGIESAGSGSDK